jgi:hypothetical protein
MESVAKNHKKRAAFVTALAAIALTFWFNKTPHFEGIWSHSQKSPTERAPASIVLSAGDLSMYEDYFSYPTYHKTLRYDLSANIWTDKDGDYLKERARLAVHDAFSKTVGQLDVGDQEKGMATLLKENLISSFVQKFVKSLAIFKIANGTFQIDFEFTPEMMTEVGFENEFASNQIIDVSRRGGVAQDLAKTDFSLIDKVAQIKIPDDGNPYQYTGGSISLWIKILDLSWDPSQPIPNVKKNAVKGFVRYRRYFRANQRNLGGFFPANAELLISSKHFQKEKKGPENHYLTVDLYKEFDLKGLVPSPDKLSISFGKLLPTDVHRDSFLARLFTNQKEGLDTGTLKLNGQFKDGKRQRNFQAEVQKLTFDLQTKEFHDSSKLYVSVDRKQNDGPLNYKVKKLILERYAKGLIDYLELNQLYLDIDLGGGQQ